MNVRRGSRCSRRKSLTLDYLRRIFLKRSALIPFAFFRASHASSSSQLTSVLSWLTSASPRNTTMVSPALGRVYGVPSSPRKIDSILSRANSDSLNQRLTMDLMTGKSSLCFPWPWIIRTTLVRCRIAPLRHRIIRSLACS